ncbi:MAG: hypothetical protein KDH96_00520 [Candidatus Riesia sp.]|nr:hypothetical protein [Candidatus Riesia sp.]
MKKILSTMDDVIKELMAVDVVVEAIIWTSVIPTMRKKDCATKSIENPYTNVRKLCKRKVQLNPVYEQAVNEQRIVEGNKEPFQGSKHRWAETINKTFKIKDDQVYLSMIIQEELLGPFYFGISVPNNPAFLIPNADVERFVPVTNTAHYQGLEKAVKYTSMKLDNILYIETDTFIYEQVGFDKTLCPI